MIDDTWYIYDGWDLVYELNQDTNQKIGIEASFEREIEKNIMEDGNFNPFLRFNIYITLWKNHDWKSYKDEVLEAFKGYTYLDENAMNNTRIFLHLNPIMNNDLEQIVSRLKTAYNTLKIIADKHKSKIVA